MEGSHATDAKLIELFKKWFAGKRVGSFGEGLGKYRIFPIRLQNGNPHDDVSIPPCCVLGRYKKALDSYCTFYHGYDGAPYTENVTENTVNFLDLSVPQFGLPSYQIVLSMEVAEHIPNKFEQVFLDNIVRYNHDFQNVLQ